MTEVFSVPSDGSPHYPSSPVRRSSLRLHHPHSYLDRSWQSSYTHAEYVNRVSASPSSSDPSSALPVDVTELPHVRLHACTQPFTEKAEAEEDEIMYNTFDRVGYYEQHDEIKELPASPAPQYSYSTNAEVIASNLGQSRTNSLDMHKIIRDDNAIGKEPTRHVDYLSHEWNEEDIWASSRYVIARRNLFSNSVRLANASWRTWAQAKDQLKTISPETINWYLDLLPTI